MTPLSDFSFLGKYVHSFNWDVTSIEIFNYRIKLLTPLTFFFPLARAIADMCILIWSIMHIYNIDKFEALRWKAIKKKEVKSLMTILFLISVATLFVYDAISTKIKYSEGFIVEPLTKKIISKPSEDWSPQNKALRHIAQ